MSIPASGLWARLIGCAVALVCWHAAAAAPPEMTYLYPAGAQQGQSVEVTAGGKFDSWPVEAWVDRPGVRIEATEKKGQFRIHIDSDAAPGTCWARVYNAEGSSSLRPFVIGTLPEIQEQESNDNLLKPQVLDTTRLIVNGRFQKIGDVDVFAVELSQGQTLIAALEGHTGLGSPMDAVLQVTDPRGFVLAHNDDAPGLDPRLIFEAPAEGTYLIRGFSFPWPPNSSIRFAGGENYVYRLTITTDGYADHAIPLAMTRGQTGEVEVVGWNIPDEVRHLTVSADSDGDQVNLFSPQLGNTVAIRVESHATVVEGEPNGQAEQAQGVEIPTTITGRIEAANDIDYFRFQADKGQTLTFAVESRQIGFPLDPHLSLIDADGKVLRQVDDANRNERDVSLSYKFPEDGKYDLAIRDVHHHGGRGYVYRLTIVEPQPDFALAVKTDRFVLQPNEPLEVPIEIERSHGFAEDIEITADGLPDGVTTSVVKSESKGKSAKEVKLHLTASGSPFSGTIQIRGRAQVENQPVLRTATAALPELSERTSDLWLTVRPAEAKAESKDSD